MRITFGAKRRVVVSAMQTITEHSYYEEALPLLTLGQFSRK
jgi:hypothetical protein